MAPEVAKDECYDKSVDVYSFGILLWELCTAEKPFFGYSGGKHLHQVVLGGQRPDLNPPQNGQNGNYKWPESLTKLMEECWSGSPSSRPTFTEIKQVLFGILNDEDASTSRSSDGEDVSTSESASKTRAISALLDDHPHPLLRSTRRRRMPGGGKLSAVFRSHDTLLPELSPHPAAPPPSGSGIKDKHNKRRLSWTFGLKRHESS